MRGPGPAGRARLACLRVRRGRQRHLPSQLSRGAGAGNAGPVPVRRLRRCLRGVLAHPAPGRLHPAGRGRARRRGQAARRRRLRGRRGLHRYSRAGAGPPQRARAGRRLLCVAVSGGGRLHPGHRRRRPGGCRRGAGRSDRAYACGRALPCPGRHGRGVGGRRHHPAGHRHGGAGHRGNGHPGPLGGRDHPQAARRRGSPHSSHAHLQVRQHVLHCLRQRPVERRGGPDALGG